ncbi:MAG: MBG domain-containing protein, partial [Phycisphaerae bacterium]
MEYLEERCLLSAAFNSRQPLGDLSTAVPWAISSTIEQDDSVYHAAFGAAGVTLANPANAFTASVQSGSLQVAVGTDTWSMSLVAFGYGGMLQPAGTAQTTTNGNRVDNNYGAIDEWYVNGPGGLEQGFNVAPAAPSDVSGSLTVQMDLSGNLRGTVNAAGDGLSLTRSDGSTALAYTGLVAYDATGKMLPASLELQADGGHQDLLIHVNTAGAQGQITIDPVVQTNLALNKTATASSIELNMSQFAPSYAVDGNMTSRWASGYSNAEWLQVDLGSTQPIGRVQLTWEPAYAKAYKIQTSNDAATWTTIYSTTTGTGGTANLTGLSGSGRYVRMQGVQRATTWGYSIYEFEVYAPATSTPTVGLTSSAGSSTYGQAVAFTVNVTATSGTPTGTVQFQSDGSNFGSPVALVSGSATSMAISTLSATNHTITAVYSGDSNFSGNSNTLTQTVARGPLTVTANAGLTKIYGAADPTLTYALTAGSLVGSDIFSGSLIRTAGTNVGTYAIGQGTLTAGSNYAITYVAANLSITAKSLTVTANSGQTKIYGAADPTLTYTLTAGSLVGSDTFTGSLTRLVGENVGSYAIGQGTLAAGSNYAISYTAANLSITAKNLTVTASSGQTKVYGAADPTLAYTLTAGSLVGSDTFTGSLTRTAGTNVGTYAISQGTLTAGSNYAISYTAANLSITAKSLTVTANSGQTKTYGATDQALTYTLTGSLVGSDTFTGSLTRLVGENMGSYAISQGTLNAGSNYAITYVAANLSVTAKSLTVTANSGQTKVYGAADPTLAYTLTAGSLVGNDTFTGSLTRAAGENVGTYTIGQGTLTAGSNYAITFTPPNFAITPEALTVTANTGQTKAYGAADPTLTYTLITGSLVGTDAFAGTLTRTVGENVGTYAIGQGTLTAGSNYAITYMTADFSITSVIVPPTDAGTEVRAGGLVFRIASGTFTQSGTVYTSTTAVSIGFIPVSGNPFVALASLSGTTTIDTESLLLSSGAVSSILNGTIPLLPTGFSDASIAQLTGAGIRNLSGSSLTVAQSTFTVNSIAFHPDNGLGQPVIQLQGALALPVGLTVAVDGANDVDISPTGVSLTGVSTALAGQIVVGGVTLNTAQLTAQYAAMNNTFTLTGAANATIGGLGTLSVQLGGGTTQGLVITNGSLTSLDATVTSNLTVGGLTITTKDLELSYAAATSTFAMTGTAGVAITKLGNLNVTFGHGTTPGLVVTSGALVSLDMTVNSSLTVSSVTITATDLQLTYAAATSTFAMTGTAGVA